MSHNKQAHTALAYIAENGHKASAQELHRMHAAMNTILPGAHHLQKVSVIISHAIVITSKLCSWRQL